MVPSSSPRRRKILFAIIILIALAAGLLLFTGCPGPKKASNSNTKEAAGPSPVRLDSIALIHHLAFLAADATQGRETGTAGNQLAREYIVRKFDSLQIDKPGDSYIQTFPMPGDSSKKGFNVIGIIKGTQYPDSYIAVTAHYDHLGVRNGNIYYGADDNASGTAGLLAMIQYFKQHPPRHSLLLAAFDAEEKGLAGSRYLVENSPVPLSAVILNVNMDMISRNDNNEIYACGIYHYPFLKKYVDSIQPVTSVNIKLGHDDPAKGSAQDWTSQSDHYAFHKKNIPFLYFGVEDHADYHKPGDTFEKINKHFYYQVSNMIAATVSLIDRQEKSH